MVIFDIYSSVSNVSDMSHWPSQELKTNLIPFRIPLIKLCKAVIILLVNKAKL